MYTERELSLIDEKLEPISHTLLTKKIVKIFLKSGEIRKVEGKYYFAKDLNSLLISAFLALTREERRWMINRMKPVS